MILNTSIYAKRIQVASKREKADIVLKNTTYLNVFTSELLTGDIAISDGYIAGIGSYDGILELDCSDKTVVPGFMDAHIHMESTGVRPDIFAKTALAHGTTTIICDPHEIANVLGTDGIDYMLEITNSLPLDTFFMIPSCVPCSQFEESGATITVEGIKQYLPHPRVLGLAELMNVPGILQCDSETLSKTSTTLSSGKLVDGHAPELSGSHLMAYVGSGIYSDHECTTLEEALEKIRAGQWIMIREGTASKNLNALLPLCKEPYASRCMFATDDRHINDIVNDGYIDSILRTAINEGVSPVVAYKMASFHTASYFHLKDRGAIAPGYIADLVLLEDLASVSIHSVYKNGVLMTQKALELTCKPVLSPILQKKVTNTIRMKNILPEDLAIKAPSAKIIGLIPGQLLTTDEGEATEIDVDNDILKLCVAERHHNTGHIGVCFLKGYGLKIGAIATSVAHDSHNMIVVGTNDRDIAFAMNAIRSMGGGMVVVNDASLIAHFALPIAGLMSTLDAEDATVGLQHIRNKAYFLGVTPDIDPFMTLSFTSLPVIPKLKLTSLGVIDVENNTLL